jgi:ribosomal-protein-alanine N-acetyltransferase
MSDYSAWYRAFVECGPAKNKWASSPKKPEQNTREVLKRVLAKRKQLAKKDEYYRVQAFEKKTGEMVGHFDFEIYARRALQFANFGYLLHNPYWGKGYATEMCAAALQIGFKHLKLHRLEGSINIGNTRSVKLAQKIGMRREGIKKRYWYEDGQWTDQIIFVATPKDIGLKESAPS